MLLTETTTLIRSLFLETVLIVSAIFCSESGCTDFNVGYVQKSECMGKTIQHFLLMSMQNVTRAECSVKCDVTYECMLFFYFTITKSCTLHFLLLENLRFSLVDDADSECYIPNDITESWAVQVSPSGIFSKMNGEPDGNYTGVLAGEELSFEISQEMYVEGVYIVHWGVSAGTLQISLLSPDDTWYQVHYSQQKVQLSNTWIRHSSPQMTPFKTAAVRIWMQDQDYTTYVDAVKVAGKTKHLNQRKSIH